jgi:hypothetical protein
MQKNVKNGMVHFKIIFGKIAGREMLSVWEGAVGGMRYVAGVPMIYS